MKSILFLSLFLVGLVGITQTLDREVIASGGDFYSNSSAQLSTTIGEIIIGAYSSTSTQLTNGFHQTNLIITALEERNTDKLNIYIFPNPSAQSVTIYSELKDDPLYYSISDALGKVMKRGELNTERVILDIESYSNGLYYLQIKGMKNEVSKVYKLIKQ